jgi:type II secretory ATPase GspE/PulE/Tfp pilus assembly ATPase PilB-like protein
LKKEKVVDAKTTKEKIPFYRATDEENSYGGRMGIHEVLQMSDGIRNAIMSGESTEKIDAIAKQEGMMSMLEDGIYKSITGITTVEEIFRVISE